MKHENQMILSVWMEINTNKFKYRGYISMYISGLSFHIKLYEVWKIFWVDNNLRIFLLL